MIHGVAEGLGAGFGDAFDHDLVELALKDVFAHAAVEERGLVQGGAHLLDELAKERLADKVGEGFLELGRIVPVVPRRRG